jgi:hypothetical protein
MISNIHSKCESNALFETGFTLGLFIFVVVSLCVCFHLVRITQNAQHMSVHNTRCGVAIRQTKCVRISAAGFCILVSCLGSGAVAVRHRHVCNIAMDGVHTISFLTNTQPGPPASQRTLQPYAVTTSISNTTDNSRSSGSLYSAQTERDEIHLWGIQMDQIHHVLFFFLWIAMCIIYRPNHYMRVFMTCSRDIIQFQLKFQRGAAANQQAYVDNSKCTFKLTQTQTKPFDTYRSTIISTQNVDIHSLSSTLFPRVVVLVVFARHLFFIVSIELYVPPLCVWLSYAGWTIFMAVSLFSEVIKRCEHMNDVYATVSQTRYMVRGSRLNAYHIDTRTPLSSTTTTTTATTRCSCIYRPVLQESVHQKLPVNLHVAIQSHPIATRFDQKRTRAAVQPRCTSMVGRCKPTCCSLESHRSIHSRTILAFTNALVCYDGFYLFVLVVFFNIETTFHFSRPLDDASVTLLHINLIQLATASLYIMFTFIEAHELPAYDSPV